MSKKSEVPASEPTQSFSPSTPLLVDIRSAAATLGISVFAVRNLCWNRQTASVLKPVRHGLKFLFSPAVLTDFVTKLINGEIQFPATPTKAKARKRAISAKRVAA